MPAATSPAHPPTSRDTDANSTPTIRKRQPADEEAETTEAPVENADDEVAGEDRNTR